MQEPDELARERKRAQLQERRETVTVRGPGPGPLRCVQDDGAGMIGAVMQFAFYEGFEDREVSPPDIDQRDLAKWVRYAYNLFNKMTEGRAEELKIRLENSALRGENETYQKELARVRSILSETIEQLREAEKLASCVCHDGAVPDPIPL